VNLDLTRRRDIGELLTTAWQIFTRHFLVFFTITLLIYGPYGVLFNGLVLQGFDEDADPAAVLASVGVALGAFVVPAIVTALHVALVQGLSRGEEPAVGTAISRVLPRLGALIVAALLYTLIVALGFVALIIPGIYLAIRLYFVTQSVVVDGEAPTGALGTSWELVKDQWWLTFGSIIVAALVSGIPINILDTLALAALDEGPAYVVVTTLLGAVGVSYTAIFGTLLFFSLRARKQVAPPPPPAEPVDTVAPERPGGLPS
jgi:hypothetical protein